MTQIHSSTGNTSVAAQDSRRERRAALKGRQGRRRDGVVCVDEGSLRRGERRGSIQGDVLHPLEVMTLDLEVRGESHPTSAGDLLQKDAMVPREPVLVVGEADDDLRVRNVQSELRHDVETQVLRSRKSEGRVSPVRVAVVAPDAAEREEGVDRVPGFSVKTKGVRPVTRAGVSGACARTRRECQRKPANTTRPLRKHTTSPHQKSRQPLAAPSSEWSRSSSCSKTRAIALSSPSGQMSAGWEAGGG